MKLMNSPRKQSGLSLLELMIAMFIGLFLLVGISSTYLYSKKTSNQRDQLSLLESNGRFALEVLSKTIQHTGYTSKTGAPIFPNKFITSTVKSEACTTGSNVVNAGIFPGATGISPAKATDDDDTNAGNGDSIGVIYLGGNGVTTDCAGESLPNACQIIPGVVNPDTSAAKIYNAFYIEDVVGEGKSLMCAGSRTAEKTIIANGIENMQILYGVNVDGSLDRSAERYVNASGVGGLWDNITSVKIAVLVRSEKEVKAKAESITYSLLDTPMIAPNDRFQRAVFSTLLAYETKVMTMTYFNNNASAKHPPKRQQGIALIMALIMLLLVTILGVSAVRMSSLDTQIAGNSIFSMLAYQAAESALGKSISEKNIVAPANDRNSVETIADDLSGENVTAGAEIVSEGKVSYDGVIKGPVLNGVANSSEFHYQVFKFTAESKIAATSVKDKHTEARAVQIPKP